MAIGVVGLSRLRVVTVDFALIKLPLATSELSKPFHDHPPCSNAGVISNRRQAFNTRGDKCNSILAAMGVHGVSAGPKLLILSYANNDAITIRIQQSRLDLSTTAGASRSTSSPAPH